MEVFVVKLQQNQLQKLYVWIQMDFTLMKQTVRNIISVPMVFLWNTPAQLGMFGTISTNIVTCLPIISVR